VELPTVQRSVVILKDVLDESLEEIAAMLVVVAAPLLPETKPTLSTMLADKAGVSPTFFDGLTLPCSQRCFDRTRRGGSWPRNMKDIWHPLLWCD
jgi:hypothetical protein